MSANNQILIFYRKPSYFVRDVDIETKNGSHIGNAKTLEKAVRIANKYLEKNVVEYGLEIRLPKNI